MPKPLLFFITLGVIILASSFIYTTNLRSEAQERFFGQYKPGRDAEIDVAINQAKHLYRLKKERGEDLTDGPCLTNALMPGWVVDLVHNPRQAVDDLAQNRCSAYLEGRAKHFIELDLNGNFIRVR